MTLAMDHLEAIAAALLAVNGYTLDKVYRAMPAIRAAGLLEPAEVVDAERGPLTVKLAAAGYDRGLLTDMFAGRLQSLMRAVAAGSLDGLPALVAAGRRGEALALLEGVKGIGPRVASTAWQLLV